MITKLLYMSTQNKEKLSSNFMYVAFYETLMKIKIQQQYQMQLMWCVKDVTGCKSASPEGISLVKEILGHLCLWGKH